MKDLIFKEIRDFFNRKRVSSRPLLLGLSGGADSMALFHLLLEARRFFPYELHAVNINHGWRPESVEEMHSLERLCKVHEVPFHGITLEKVESFNNIENTLREKRYDEFEKIYKEIGAEALVLAHHSDDLAETVLKRLMEGAHFLSINGLKEDTFFRGMHILRPLLKICKKDILLWLQERGIGYFEDPTNKDINYLRARMREQIFPYLEEMFGKNATSNFAKIASSIEELNDYLAKKAAPYKALVETTAEGKSWEVPSSIEKIEFEYVIKELSRELGVFIPYALLQDLWIAFKENKNEKQFIFKSGKFLLINRKFFLVLNN